MASHRVAAPARHVFTQSSVLGQCRRSNLPAHVRSLTTETAGLSHPALTTSVHDTNTSASGLKALLGGASSSLEIPESVSESSTPRLHQPPPNPFLKEASCTLYTFPSMEPAQVVNYPSTHLMVPLRKDILHRAVIYEGDKTRQGTASTKWRSAVHGSHKKLFPQKGTGRARVGDKQSPIRRGGGVAHGPHPRDFSTDLPRKVYDLAFRTALSHRYRQGELIVINSILGMVNGGENVGRKYIEQLLVRNDLRGSMFVTQEEQPLLKEAIGVEMRTPARALTYKDVDVKNLLEGRQIVIEQDALESLFMQRQEDLVAEQRISSLKYLGLLGFRWNQREWNTRPWNRAEAAI